jgi:Zn-dependent protease with chaperone function
MRIDTANRSFFGLLGGAFVAYQLLGLGACVLVAGFVYRLSADGPDSVAGGLALVPAVAFLAVVAAGALTGLHSVLTQSLSSLRLSRRLRELALPLPEPLAQEARHTRLGGRLRLIDSGESFSFAYGAFSPRVAVSRGLLSSVSPPELAAVLAHERYHVRNLDPLKVVLARALRAGFFYLPVLEGMQARYVAERELAADRGALSDCGRTPLAGALLKVVRGPGWPELGTAAAIGGPELLDARIEQLETGRGPRVGAVSRGAVVLTALAALSLAAAAALATAGAGGLESVVRATMPEMELRAGGLLLGAAACALPWVGAAAGFYGVLSWRARRELGRDLTRRHRSTTLAS